MSEFRLYIGGLTTASADGVPPPLMPGVKTVLKGYVDLLRRTGRVEEATELEKQSGVDAP